jgi:hypothetical protein
MANPSVTYTFTNGTTADGTQVSQNFTDLINSLTNGTKSLNIDAITAAGTATLNGDSIIGNGSGDASTVNATMSFATTPKTDAIAEKTAGAGVTLDGILLKDAGIFGRVDGAEIGAGYVGEFKVASTVIRSGTNGFSYSVRDSDIVSAATGVGYRSVVGSSLKKGQYIVSGSVNSSNPDAASRVFFAYIDIGGQITQALQLQVNNNYDVTLTLPTIPIVISDDNITVSIKVKYNALGAGTTNYGELFVMRVA